MQLRKIQLLSPGPPKPMPPTSPLPITPPSFSCNTSGFGTKIFQLQLQKMGGGQEGHISPSSLSPCPQPRPQTAEAGAGGGLRRDFHLKLRIRSPSRKLAHSSQPKSGFLFVCFFVSFSFFLSFLIKTREGWPGGTRLSWAALLRQIALPRSLAGWF